VGSDNIIKIFAFDLRETPLLIIEFKGETLTDVCWVGDNPNYIAVLTAEGSVHLYNLADTIERPAETIQIPKISLDHLESILSSVVQHSIIVVSRLGNIWQLALSSNMQDDRFLLDKVYTS